MKRLETFIAVMAVWTAILVSFLTFLLLYLRPLLP